MRRTHLALAGLLCLLVAACGDGIREGVNEGAGNRGTIDGVSLHTPDSVVITDPVTTPEITDPPFTFPESDDSVFAWTSYTDGVESGTLEVPLDYADPSAGTVTLYLSRHKASDPSRRIGTLLVNPGGPGFGGSVLAENAEQIYGQDLLDRFDIIGWDPRGTGFSDPSVDCVDDDDRYFAIDTSPDTPDEEKTLTVRAQEFAAACQRKMGDVLPFLSTEDSARDMDSIRRALGEDTISYFGFSYGSELGATWATMFPDTVRAMVIDGAIDPTVGYLQQNLQQAAGFEATFDAFLANCSADTACPFHNGGDAEGAFDDLDQYIDRFGRPVDNGRPTVTQGVLDTAIAAALYDQSGWPQLEQALADLQKGDGTGIVDLYDQYYGYADGEWDNGNEAYFAINCLDDPGTSNIADVFALGPQLAAVAPRLGRSWMGELAICASWPVQRTTPPIAITGAGAGPILVVGTTGDPATPLDGTRRMAQALEDGHLVIVDAEQHTGYGVNRCVDDTVDGYLVDPSVPLKDEIDCT